MQPNENVKPPEKHAGADWLNDHHKSLVRRAELKPVPTKTGAKRRAKLEEEIKRFTLSPLGVEVADILGQVFLGIYHIDDVALKTDWSNPYYIHVILRHQDMATFDDCKLTVLVMLCHDRAIRCGINGHPGVYHSLDLIFHPRKRVGQFSQRHPTMEDAIRVLRARIGLPIIEELPPEAPALPVKENDD